MCLLVCVYVCMFVCVCVCEDMSTPLQVEVLGVQEAKIKEGVLGKWTTVCTGIVTCR